MPCKQIYLHSMWSFPVMFAVMANDGSYESKLVTTKTYFQNEVLGLTVELIRTNIVLQCLVPCIIRSWYSPV
jgi:hypothetical protein